MEQNTFQELEALLDDVYRKTGTRVSLTPTGGEETRFSLDYGNRTVDAYLVGTGKEAEARVELVRYAVAGAASGRVLSKEEQLKGILLGEGGEWAAFRFMTQYALKDKTYFAADVVLPRHIDEAYSFLQRIVEGSAVALRLGENRIALILIAEEEPADFCRFVYQSLYEELGVKAEIGLGCEVKFPEIAASYSQAVTTVKMSRIFHRGGEVHSYREYMLATMLKDIDGAKLKEYARQFRIESASEVFTDPDLVNTAEQFLESGLNVSEAARALFLHRNTLTYRLEKIKRATGLDIRCFADAVTFRVISILNKLLTT